MTPEESVLRNLAAAFRKTVTLDELLMTYDQGWVHDIERIRRAFTNVAADQPSVGVSTDAVYSTCYHGFIGGCPHCAADDGQDQPPVCPDCGDAGTHKLLREYCKHPCHIPDDGNDGYRTTEMMGKVCAYILLGIFWLFVLVPTYPFFGILCVIIARQLNDDNAPGYLEFAKDWFSFRVIPFRDC